MYFFDKIKVEKNFKRYKNKKYNKNNYSEDERVEKLKNEIEKLNKIIDSKPKNSENKEIETNEEKELFKKCTKRKEYLMTYTEIKFFRQLKEYLKEKEVYIFTKVRLVDLVEIDNKESERFSAFAKIKSKHIDFIITDYKGKILKAIELDDYTHKNWSKTDNTKNNLFSILWIDFIRIRVQNNYNLESSIVL